ncbi:MAG: type II and III secretion system protein, partial [Desulfobacterales bacterium]|nr:type II and III secretion system protein [Desulfobacterales bacterium]
LDATLQAMESRGKLKIISAPKIITLDNKTAIISQGIKYPYLKLDEAGNTTLEFENIDLVLKVTPHVTPDDRISMNIEITKADLGLIYDNMQSFTTKEANTELLVDDGDTIVIGGIIKTTKNLKVTGVPGLSKIPLLGWLFKSTEKTDDKEELLIFITPRIVKLEQRGLEN